MSSDLVPAVFDGVVIDDDIVDAEIVEDDPWAVSTPCVVDGMPEEVYHADPVVGGSLSQSRLKLLLDPGTPAGFRWASDNPPEPKREFAAGHAAHALVLGVGLRLVEVDAPDWRTAAARAMRDEAYAAGAVPVLSKQLRQVEDMAAALASHPDAAAVLTECPARELSMFAHLSEWPVWLRGRFDMVGDGVAGDYKTTVEGGAHPDAFTRKLFDYGYDLQDATYRRISDELGLGVEDLWFVVQEKEPPYLVGVYQLDPEYRRIGRTRLTLAVERYLECVESGMWPGYAAGRSLLSPPPWIARRFEQPTDTTTGTPVRRGGHDETTLAELDALESFLEGLH